MSSFLLSQGFIQSFADSSLFVFKSDHAILYFLLYVDDIIITGSSSTLLNHFIKKYIRELVQKQGMTNYNPVQTPITPRTSHSDVGSPLSNPHEYRCIVGSLQYLSFTRPDITYAMNQASQYMYHPTSIHLSAVKRILGYLSGSITQSISITVASSFSIIAYSDSDWVGCPQTRRSISGYCVLFSGNLVSWSSNKQPTVARSSTEAEYRALTSVAAEITWLQMLLKDIYISLSAALVALCNNISATYLAYNPILHSRSKHIAIDYHFVREKVLLGDLTVQHVPTQLQLVDIFTKDLSSSKFKAVVSNLCLPH
ncbi:transmembrane signal receptor [Lithospermum erythrorhizon]|uniref:Transmembrane signal receptor n=1 Tax=Lithospermum erythrorhizon TaxID=34254 RepID=A0AAV3RNC9_LITER